MARRKRTLPARRQSAFDDSLLIRSAESLGRMIGLLQRQLDAARQATSRDDVSDIVDGNGHEPVRKRTARAKTAGKNKGQTAKRASTSAAKKAGASNGSGATQRASRSGRRT